MDSIILPPPSKYCVWLDFVNQIIPLDILTCPEAAGYQKRQVKFGFLPDKFDIQVIKIDSTIKVNLFRNMASSDKKHDDGYALRFFITVSGFDEGPQVSVMYHNQRSEPPATFKLTETILTNINTTHYLFDVFVVAEMLEFKNVDEVDEVKMRSSVYLSSYFIHQLSQKELKHLCYILKCSSIYDVYTGRLPANYMSQINNIIGVMSRDYTGIALYLKARQDCQDLKTLYPALNKILRHVDLEDRQGPLSIDEACVKYLLAHKLGLDCLKIITKDYLLYLLDKDCNNVLDVLEVALQVHDEDLSDKAIFVFLNNFYAIRFSEKFEDFSNQRAHVTRFMIHSARVWVTEKYTYIPGWKMSS